MSELGNIFKALDFSATQLAFFSPFPSLFLFSLSYLVYVCVSIQALACYLYVCLSELLLHSVHHSHIHIHICTDSRLAFPLFNCCPSLFFRFSSFTSVCVCVQSFYYKHTAGHFCFSDFSSCYI